MTTVDQQIETMGKRWPGFRVIDRGASHVEWRGILAPDKREHLVRVRHRIPMVLENISLHNAQPRVQVLNPLLERHPDYQEGPIPHVYPNRDDPDLPYLCLFSPTMREWDINDLIAHTTIHWAAQWLYFYEGWLLTKKWLVVGDTQAPKTKRSALSQPPRRSSGTLQGLREPLPWPEGRPFRILSIDGGGIRGILPATMLSELESRYLGGCCIGDYFDMITGTSTGGIIALGLSIGKTAKAILDLYIEHGDKVFPPARFDLFNIRKAWRWVQGAQHHRYDPAKLEAPLKHIFGSSKIGNAKRRLCIPSFDGFTEVNVFKTPHHRDYKMDWKEDMVTVAMATAAAPTYFPVYKNGQRMFADGGVWANNPVMIGLVDALACYQLQRRQVHILSLGTGDAEIQFSEGQILHGGLWDWAEIITSAMHLQSQNAIGQAGLLIGRDQLIRLNAPPPPSGTKPIELDDYARARADLPDVAQLLIEEHGDVIRSRFLFEPANIYGAFYGPRAEA